jgi:hypothetical protein
MGKQNTNIIVGVVILLLILLVFGYFQFYKKNADLQTGTAAAAQGVPPAVAVKTEEAKPTEAKPAESFWRERRPPSNFWVDRAKKENFWRHPKRSYAVYEKRNLY